MENQMFCFQCQETAKGIGCTVKGVCGKLPSTSKYMDLLLSVVRGVGAIDTALRKAEVERPQGVGAFIVDALFSTITNANFDDAAILRRVDKGIVLKRELLNTAQKAGQHRRRSALAQRANRARTQRNSSLLRTRFASGLRATRYY